MSVAARIKSSVKLRKWFVAFCKLQSKQAVHCAYETLYLAQ